MLQITKIPITDNKASQEKPEIWTCHMRKIASIIMYKGEKSFRNRLIWND